MDLYQYVSQFGAKGPVTLRLYRKSPMSHRGVKTNGSVAVYQHPVTMDQIADEHGGGHYELQIFGMRKDKKSGRVKHGYITSRSFDVAGVPKISGLIPQEDDEADDHRGKGNGDYSDGPVTHALNMAQRLADARESEVQELRTSMRSSGMDRDLIETILGPIQEQVRELNRAKSDLELRLFDVLNKPKDDTDDKWLRVFGDKEQNHSNNLEAVRQQYEARIARLQDFHQDELKRFEDRFEREIQHVRAAAEREIQTLKLAHQQALDSQRHGFEMRIDGLKDIQKRLEREVTKAESEVGELRGRKEQGPLDQIQGLVQLKQGFDALIPTGGGEERSGWEKLVDIVSNSRLGEGVMARLAQAAGGAEEEVEPEAPQLIAVTLPDGRVVNVPPQVLQRMREQHMAKERRKQELGADIPEISESDMAKAIAFMEAAYRNATDPAMFAASARNMLPEDIMTALKAVGVDVFLSKVAKLQSGSPLATIQGRTWVRRVAAHLLGEDPDAETDATDEPDDIEDQDDQEVDDEPSDDEDDSDSPVESP